MPETLLQKVVFSIYCLLSIIHDITCSAILMPVTLVSNRTILLCKLTVQQRSINIFVVLHNKYTTDLSKVSSTRQPILAPCTSIALEFASGYIKGSGAWFL